MAYSSAEIRLWNLEDHSLVREFTTGNKEPGSSTIALSADGKILAAMFRDKICIWEVATGQLLRTIDDYHNSHGPRTHAIAISPDNKSLAAIAPRHEVLMWDLETGMPKARYPESHSSFIDGVACSPNSKVVASCAGDGTVRLWQIDSGRQIRVLEIGEKLPRAVHAVKFSPNGSLLAQPQDMIGRNAMHPELSLSGNWTVRRSGPSESKDVGQLSPFRITDKRWQLPPDLAICSSVVATRIPLVFQHLEQNQENCRSSLAACTDEFARCPGCRMETSELLRNQTLLPHGTPIRVKSFANSGLLIKGTLTQPPVRPMASS